MAAHRSPRQEKQLVDRLTRWFTEIERPFPWRSGYEPYAVWLSEIMLQQTQAERGARYFDAWMRRFPDIASVAAAGEEEVLAAWEGLGYYSRARNLHAAAKRIMTEHGGRFPASVAAIRELPGVGEYTAGAIASIAFNLPEPAVDANVLRIFARLDDLDLPIAGKEAKALITGAVRRLMPATSPRLFNQALMELGALVCGKTPECARCPVAELCLARQNGTLAERPVKTGKAAYRTLETVAGIVRRNGLVFVRKRPPGGMWAGLWEFPGGVVDSGENPRDALVRHLAEQMGGEVVPEERIGTVRHGYTTWRVTLHGFFCTASKQAAVGDGGGTWLPVEGAARLAFAAGHRKLLERIGWK